MDILENWTDTLKFYSVKIWPSIDEWICKLFSYNFWLQMLQKLWWGLKRQTNVTHLAIIFTSSAIAITIFSYLYVKITKRNGKSEAKLIDKTQTVLITGAKWGHREDFLYDWGN